MADIWYKKINWILLDLDKISFSKEVNKQINVLLNSTKNILEYIWENDKKINFKKIKWQKNITDISINCKYIDIILKDIDDENLKNRILDIRKNYPLKDLREDFLFSKIDKWNEKDRNEKIDILIILKNKWYFTEEKYLFNLSVLFKNISFKGLSYDYEKKYWKISDFVNKY